MSGVAITGLGVRSPVGNTVEALWAELLRAETRPSRLAWADGAPGGHAYRMVAGSEGDPGVGRVTSLALAAARDALADTALAPDTVVGVCVGTGTGDGDLLENERDGTRSPHEDSWWPYGTAAALAEELALTGPSHMVTTACAAGAYAVSLGAQMIRNGEADAVLVGGSEVVSRPAQAAFMRLGAVDPVCCRPFDADRSGTVYGEGAAFLVLEDAERAATRGRAITAVILGDGWSCDAHHATAPAEDGRGALEAAHKALAGAGLTPEDIGAVVCHGTGTPLNDAVEGRVLSQLLPDGGRSIAATAVKSTLGHSGGAAGAFSTVVAALIIRTGIVPPIANLAGRDVDCTLALISGTPARSRPGAVLVNAYAFGGNNISLLVGAP